MRVITKLHIRHANWNSLPRHDNENKSIKLDSPDSKEQIEIIFQDKVEVEIFIKHLEEVAKQLNTLGLDCSVGFYHRNHESHLALVYDMIEPFRHLVDRSIFEVQDQIKKKDYAFSREGIVVLSDELKKKYIALLSTIFDRKRVYKARTGIRRRDGYQRMEEITIMKMKCVELKYNI